MIRSLLLISVILFCSFEQSMSESTKEERIKISNEEVDEMLSNSIPFEELERRSESNSTLLYLKSEDMPFSGSYKISYESGKTKLYCQIKEGMRNGTAIYFDENGTIRMLQNWKNSKADGTFVSFRKDGTKMSKTIWRNDQKLKEEMDLNDDGTIKEWPIYINWHLPRPPY